MNKNYLLKSLKVRIRYLLLTLVAVFTITNMQAQEISVTGTVVGADDGYPIIGASVVVEGQNKGTVTNLDGVYVIKTKIGTTLKFSYIGMMSQSIKVTGAKLDVRLKSNTIALDEVVAIGYGTVKKKELIGAVAQVKAEDIASSVSSDLGSALQGKVSGVNIVASSGAPGASSEILIRGVSSISGSNTPLYVVDGVPQEGDPRIGANEIETIDILKDAASCAIYGTRGAAGVILITTKQGKAGQLRVAFDASYGVQHITSGTSLMNSAEQTYFDIVSLRNISTNVPDDQFVLNLQKYQKGFQNDNDIMTAVITDYTPTQTYNFNISGGNKELTYNVVAGYYDQQGVVVNSGFSRFNTRANTNYKSGKWQIGTSIGLTTEDKDTSPSGIFTQAIKYYPTQDQYDPNGDDVPTTFSGDGLNRLSYIVESLTAYDKTKRVNALANFNANLTINKFLRFTARGGITYGNDYGKAYRVYREVKDIYGGIVGSPSGSYVDMNAVRRNSFTYDAGFNYQRTFKKHKFTGYLGYSREKYSLEQFEAKKTGLLTNTISVLNAATGDQSATSGFDYTNTLIGSIARLQYDYKGKYLFSGTMRADQSSKFSKENRTGYFPSVSLGWSVSDEKFWKPLEDVATSLKLRASYGTTGNQNFTPYSNASSITSNIDAVYSNGTTEASGSGAIQTSYSNALVKWETSIQGNLGFDLSLFDNKITVSGEYYNTKKNDMLFPISVPGSTGGGTNATVVLNVGDMTNQGYELALSYKFQTAKVKWNLNSTFSTNKNIITKINGLGGFTFTNDYGLVSGAKDQSQVTVLAEGYEAGAFFLYKTNGIIDTHEKLAEYSKISPNPQMGDLIYVDSNKDGVISNADRVYCGSGLSKFEIGGNIKAEYENFDLLIQLYSAIGQKIMNGAKATAFSYGRASELIYAWSEANPITSIPAYRGDLKSSSANYKGYTDQWLEDGTFLRVKNVTLGYSLPKKALKLFKVDKLRVFVSAQNPLTLTNYTGYDPEVGGGVSNRGLDKGNYPVTSLYSAGVNLNF